MAKTLDKIEDATALELYLYQLGQRHIHYLPPRIDVKTWAIFKVISSMILSFIYSCRMLFKPVSTTESIDFMNCHRKNVFGPFQ